MGLGRNQFMLFLLGFLIAFGGGYLYFHNKTPGQAASPPGQAAIPSGQAATPNQNTDKKEATPETAQEGRIFVQRGCIQCHGIKSLNIQGGAAGPDLSKAYTTVEAKHGMPLEDFLKKPNSAVMSGVLGGKPLTDEERQAVIAALKAASEKP